VALRATLPGGAVLVYSGDSGEAPALAELARGADLFACECSFPDEHEVEHHLTPSGAGRLAAAAACRRLLLTHFYPETDPVEAGARAARVFGGRIELARDGSVHSLP
jgi:ribonuclease BN (tRNA processing enzyme)